jgi:hypothetical protein
MIFKKRISETLVTIWEENETVVAPMFVFIDELDRCRPSFAIRMLEEAKHLFDIDGIVFVIATDSEQLAHSIRAVYGEGFEARRYLRRFFDRVFVFPETDRTEFAKGLFEQSGISEDTFYQISEVPAHVRFAQWMRAFDVTNRDAEQCFEVVSTFVTSWTYKVRIEIIFLLTLIWSAYSAQWQVLDQQGSFSFEAQKSYLNRWTFPIMRLVRQLGNYQKQEITAYGFLSELNGRANIELNEAAVSRNSPLDDLFEEEFRSLHNSSFNPRTPPKSVLTEYANRVRNAGRLVLPSEFL